MAEPARPGAIGRSIVLVVSLCLNVLLLPLAIVVITAILQRDTGVGGGNGVLAPHFIAALVPAERARIEVAIDAHRQKMEALRHVAGQARKRLFALLASADQSAGSLHSAMADVAAAEQAVRAEALDLSADCIAVLTPAERQVLVQRIRQRNKSWLFKTFGAKY